MKGREQQDKMKSKPVYLATVIEHTECCLCLKITRIPFGRYIPDATNAIYDVLKETTQLHKIKKKCFEDKDAELLGKVSTI